MEDNEKLFAKFRDELLTRQRLNSTNYDKAILTLSTAGLGISFSFVHYVFASSEITNLFLLKISWAFFACSIISTLCSFVVSQIALSKQIYFAEMYYIKRKEEYFFRKNRLNSLTKFMNIAAGILFITAITFTLLFFWINVKEKNTMASKKNDNVENTMEGQLAPDMQKPVMNKKDDKGQIVPPMQQLPDTTPNQESGASENKWVIF